ncbi:MAG: DoxX family membrane protein [Chitinophagaceae bacterium]
MNILHRLEHWGDTHHPKWVDIIRIALGIFLVIKGLQVPAQMSTVLSSMPNFMSGNYFLLNCLQYLILFVHLMGGAFLIFGVFVRFACLIQIPVLIAAIVMILSTRDAWNPFTELPLAILVLGLLCYFLVVGNGSLSVSKYLQEGQKT